MPNEKRGGSQPATDLGIPHKDSLPNNKIADQLKLKAFAADKLNDDKVLQFESDGVDNSGKICLKNPLFLQCFKKPSLSGSTFTNQLQVLTK